MAWDEMRALGGPYLGAERPGVPGLRCQTGCCVNAGQGGANWAVAVAWHGVGMSRCGPYVSFWLPEWSLTPRTKYQPLPACDGEQRYLTSEVTTICRRELCPAAAVPFMIGGTSTQVPRLSFFFFCLIFFVSTTGFSVAIDVQSKRRRAISEQAHARIRDKPPFVSRSSSGIMAVPGFL